MKLEECRDRVSQYERSKFRAQRKSRTGVYLKCESCQQDFYVTPSRIKQAEKQGATTRYCSMKCYDKNGDKNPFFNRTHSQDSVAKMAASPNRPRFAVGGQNPNVVRFGETFVYETARPIRQRLMLERGEKCERCGYADVAGVLELHHVDRNRRNNRPENLLVLCPTCHSVDHFKAKDGQFSGFKAAA